MVAKQIINKSDLILAINNSKTMPELLDKVKVSRYVIMQNCLDYGIQKPSYKVKCDDGFFNVSSLTEKSMYWAGFLAADGCCCHSNSSYETRLNLATTDRDHIEKFKSDIKSEAKIHDYERKPSKMFKQWKKEGINIKNTYYSSTITITSKQIFNDLAMFNIVPKKTYIYEMPQWLVSHSLVRHFIRGYIDGDGSIGIREKQGVSKMKKCMVISLTGVSNVVSQIFHIIRSKCDISTGAIFIAKKEHFADQFHMSFSTLFDIQKIVYFLYNDTTVFMDRKYNKAKQVYDILKTTRILRFDPIQLQILYDKLGSFSAMAKVLGHSRTVIRTHFIDLGLKYKKMPQMNRKKK